MDVVIPARYKQLKYAFQRWGLLQNFKAVQKRVGLRVSFQEWCQILNNINFMQDPHQ